MRLSRVEHGHGFVGRLKLKILGLVSGRPPPDVVKTLLYRPEVFGANWGRLGQPLLRGRSEWSVGERELFAAFVSRLNQCVF